jgi:hypothetical protein
MDSIIDLSEINFNVNSISFSTPKPTGTGGKSVGIYQNKGIFRVSLPEMIQWGAADFKDPNGKGNDKFDFTLQFPNNDYKNDETSNCLKNMQAIEAKFLEAGQQNSKQWFGKVYPAEVLSALWSPMLKYPKNKSTGEPDLTAAPGFRIKLPKWEGEWKSEVYNEDSEKLFPDPSNELASPVDFLTKGVKATCLIQCGGLWFANGKFGVTWKLIQAVVPKPKPSLIGTCFLKKKIVPVADDDMPAKPTPLTRQTSIAVPASFVEDSDEEGGNEEGGDEEDASAAATTTEEQVTSAAEVSVAAPVSVASAAAAVPAEDDKKKKPTKKASAK